MRDTMKGIVEELRESARLDALELEVPVEDVPATEAADLIDHLTDALAQIRDGVDDPVAVARQALDPVLWMVRS